MAEISVVGLGPGDFALVPPMAAQALEQAQILVGYTTYIDLLPPDLVAGKKIVSTGMTREMDRAAQAVDLALDGARVAVVSSGDAGVYGMAGLVLEIIEARGAWDKLDCQVIPGIPALCAASALLGAPLAHDFAAISLSDLLTPWEVIEKRVRLAAEADFVIALYNPKSKKRRNHLQNAVAAIRHHQTATTPVGLVKNAFRQGQQIITSTLDDFDPEQADMLCIVIIGNSTSRLINNKILTPRGYFTKYVPPTPAPSE